ncbi:MAG: DUF5693 family protein [Bacillota bacterium]|uniref:Uncharacterized protein n=1 Tax=Thermanaerosceptrum fracticalcis TaxID=1712410 RepID=A0A7G6E4I3_THEFR|nr:DUF5693 family protein [Thermanaerosceptrum fracticalcis]QNB46987.1 hypothetical protein BR63_12125 [Thermanaerosceptrum fracticalcis]
MSINKKLLNRLAVALIIISLLASLYVDFYRVEAEERNKTVEILVNYDELLALSMAHQVPLETLAAQFKEAGATGVLMKERTVKDLDRMGRAVLFTGGQLAFQQEINKDLFPGFKPVKEHSYLFIKDKAAYESVYKQLGVKITMVTTAKDDEGYLLSLPLSPKELENLGVGFIKEDILALEKGGLKVAPQIRDWVKPTNQSIDVVVDSLKEIPGLALVAFNDRTIPGRGDKEFARYLARKLGELNVPVGIFEFFPQQGLEQLAALMNKKAVRIHAISENEMGKYTEDQAVDRFNLAVTERNIRVLFVRFFGLEQPGTALNNAVNYVERVKNNLVNEGFQVGQASQLAGVPYSGVIILAAGLGVIGGLILGANYLFGTTWGSLLGILALFGWAGILFLAPNLARKAMALAAVVLFPVLGTISVIREERRSLSQAVPALLKMSAISLIGAVIMTGLLSDKSFMLKLDQFVGVKLAHIAPLLIIPVYFLFRDTDPVKKAKELLDFPILLKHALAGVLLLAGLVVYIIRTGNDGTALVSSWEAMLRDMLDRVLWVRPRTKEFLLGHPAMLALLYYGYDLRKIMLLILGIIGQVSLVNTYAHIHTPLMISLIRSFHGLWLGIVIGIIIIVLVNYSLKWYGRRMTCE